jgi:hypothetical protein
MQTRNIRVSQFETTSHDGANVSLWPKLGGSELTIGHGGER